MLPYQTDIARIFEGLKGQWRFEREISGQGHALGEASFTPISDSELLYQERGKFQPIGRPEMSITQEYLYELSADAKAILVYFSDSRAVRGRLFHRLEIPYNFDQNTKITLICDAHLCGADSYLPQYVFNYPSLFTITYTVKGPKKDYRSITSFEKN